MNVKLFAFVLFAGLLLAGCTQPSPAPTATPSATAQASAPAIVSASIQASVAASVSAGQVQEVSMTAKKFEFTPSTVTVKKGVPVKLTVKAEDVPHGFSMPEYGIKKDLSPGESVVIEFTPDKAGSFTFFCSVFCGEGHGNMKGTLIVEG